MTNFKELASKRRTVYHLGRNTEVSQEEISNYLSQVLQEVPTAFNSQTSRIVIVFGDKHEALWQEIYNVQEQVLAGDMWDMMSGVIQGAQAGLGTVLFFEDRDQVAQMPTNSERQEAYKQNNSANNQYAAWLALAELGLGASLQHFNIGYAQGFDKSIKELLDLPASYELVAQMPFGSVETPAQEKDYLATEEKIQVIG
ncbi:nitroreductase [Aerococcus urinaehominis]|uniref:Nitroreductase n=1 Tax=Aerococcus urinaehominis TaxID=128944 RepID=A0A0X8FLF2_9LACT|nr:nitroreductase family protein [Aerococcus urinaehominis]AMB99387.1 nitroreductase [Aerococcus urinaehominis]SDM23401.1 hypothetical protein SAMN04487985_10944 [Aerococcus urinaehominis]